MTVESIHINSFGTLRSFDADFSDGLNIIEGVNEAGKTAIAMFIKFIFYGLSGRPSDTGLSEKKRFVNWDTGEASGSLTMRCSKGHFRIERTLYITTRSDDPSKESSRETLRIIDAETNSPVLKGENPADVFIGVSEDVFLNTVFIRQLSGAKVSGSEVQNAIENMLYSADENVNTEKAIEKLDKARKALLHKNENGGEIYELRRSRDALTAELADAQKRGEETLVTEASLSESKIRLHKTDAEHAHLKELVAAYSVISAKRKLDAMHAAEIKLDALKKQVNVHATSPASAEFYSDIVATSDERKKTNSRITEIENATERCNTSLAEYDNITLDEDPERNSLAEFSYRLETRKRNSIILTVVMLAFAAFFTASSFTFLSGFIYSNYVLAGAGALAAVGIIFLIRTFVTSSKLRGILEDWDVNRTGDIEDAITEYNNRANEKRALLSEKDELSNAMTDARSSLRILLARLKTMCSSLGVEECGDTDAMTAEALTVCANITKEREDARRERDTVNGRLSVLSEQLAAYDPEKLLKDYESVMATPAGKEASLLTPSAAAEAERERDFKAGAFKSQTERTHELETRLSALRALSPDPAIISVALNDTANRLQSLEKQHAAYQLAISALNEATENLRAGILPRITRRACDIMTCLSRGKYKTVGINDDFAMSFSVYGMTREVEYLSAGTRDVAYISLRIALVETLFEKENVPAIFDESFARIDEDRLAALLGFLAAENGMQSFVFTCRSLEGTLAENAPGAKIISL